jgi:Protein of unknown function (DUF3140)
MANDDRQQTIDEFSDAVNMTRKELEDWLQTDESKSVGQSDGGGESKGHESGRKIVELLEKNKSDYTDEDVEHMKRVNAYVKRHLGQGPKGDVEHSECRYSLIIFSNATNQAAYPDCHAGRGAGDRSDSGIATAGSDPACATASKLLYATFALRKTRKFAKKFSGNALRNDRQASFL